MKTDSLFFFYSSFLVENLPEIWCLTPTVKSPDTTIANSQQWDNKFHSERLSYKEISTLENRGNCSMYNAL